MRVRAAIPCGFPGCGQTAAVVELIPKGVAYADGQKDVLHELDSHFSGQGTFRVSDFLPFVDYSFDVGDDYEAVVAAVRGAGDDVAAVLYKFSNKYKVYAPFFLRRVRVFVLWDALEAKAGLRRNGLRLLHRRLSRGAQKIHRPLTELRGDGHV